MNSTIILCFSLKLNFQKRWTFNLASALFNAEQNYTTRYAEELKEKFGLTYFFISHDLGVIAQIADRVVVMYLGEKIEESNVNELFLNPKRTQKL